MILLPPGNRILRETVAAVLTREEEEGKPLGKEDPMDVKLNDFDDVSYNVFIKDGAMTVQMQLPCYDQIKDKGAEAALKETFGDKFTEPGVGYNVAVKIQLDSIPGMSEEDREKEVDKLALLKPTAVGAVFRYHYDALHEGKVGELQPFKFDIRPDTEIFFVPGKDNVTTVFAVDFQEEVDKVIAGVFMNEIQVGQRKVNGAPPTKWKMDGKPDELASFDVNVNNYLGFISFAVQKRHADPKMVAGVVQCLQSFRSFLQYHIKMSKSYWHSKMRAKTQDLLKVLNRAKIDDPNAKKNMKTSSGKTFKR